MIVQGVIGTYLLGNKAVERLLKQNELNQKLKQDEMEEEDIEIAGEEEEE